MLTLIVLFFIFLVHLASPLHENLSPQDQFSLVYCMKQTDLVETNRPSFWKAVKALKSLVQCKSGA